MQLVEPERIEVEFSRDPMTILAAVDWMRRHRLNRWERFVGQVLSRWVPPILFGIVVHSALSLILGPTASASSFFAIIAFLTWFDGMPRLSRLMFRRLSTAPGQDDPVRYDLGPDGFTARQNHIETRVNWRAVTNVALTPRGLFAAFGGDVAAIPANAWSSAEARAADAARIEAWWRAATGATA